MDNGTLWREPCPNPTIPTTVRMYEAVFFSSLFLPHAQTLSGVKQVFVYERLRQRMQEGGVKVTACRGHENKRLKLLHYRKIHIHRGMIS